MGIILDRSAIRVLASRNVSNSLWLLYTEPSLRGLSADGDGDVAGLLRIHQGWLEWD
jgi:hypothetical protein